VWALGLLSVSLGAIGNPLTEILMRFSIRSLLILMIVAAIFASPVYRFSADLYERWNVPKKVTVQVPDGGIIIMGGHRWRLEHVGGKRVRVPF